VLLTCKLQVAKSVAPEKYIRQNTQQSGMLNGSVSSVNKPVSISGELKNNSESIGVLLKYLGRPFIVPFQISAPETSFVR
jgi:hypothetical protein